MNAGDDIPGSVIKQNLECHASFFDRVIVVDGNLTESAKQFYNKFSNVIVLDSPWKDSYVDQYLKFAEQLKDNEWVLYLDCDEVPSKELIDFINSDKFDTLSQTYNMMPLPCILHLQENDKFYPSEPLPEKHFHGQWVKKILFKKTNTLQFSSAGSHVIANQGKEENYIYIPFPYYHFKTLESFVLNDVWQAFLSPEGQHYTSAESVIFKSLVSQFKSTKEFKNATQKGAWPLPLQKFAWDRRKEFDRPISRLSWVYWILYSNKCHFGDFDLTWKDVKSFVLSKDCIDLFNKNIKNNNYFNWK